MAEKRMFSKSVIDSDAFLDMALSTQALYFHLAMRADDDGFLNNPKKVTRMIGCNEDELKVLIMKKFLIAFDTGVIVITHWKQHNNVRKDMYKPTLCKSEFAMLSLDENKVYSLGSTTPAIQMNVPDVITDDEKPAEEPEKKATRFKPPTVEEVREYCKERNNKINPEAFVDFYQSKGWKVGKNPMKDWKAAVRNWERKANENNFNSGYSNRNPPVNNSTADDEYWARMLPNY